MGKSLKNKLLYTYGVLARAAARKKVYSLKAKKDGHHGVSHLLRAMAESEMVQARRLLHNVRGQVDTSDAYLTTILDAEIPEVLAQYEEMKKEADKTENAGATQALHQLSAAERSTRSLFRSMGSEAINESEQSYYVCQFCGYICSGSVPSNCPVCAAAASAFHQIG